LVAAERSPLALKLMILTTRGPAVVDEEG
jgi:hypothetical protein